MRARFVFLVGLLVVSGCSYMEVQTDYDELISFDGLRTYSWTENETEGYGTPSINSPFLGKHIKASVDQSLARRGYELSESAKPDFVVAFRVITDQKQQLATYNTYPHYGFGHRGFGHRDFGHHRYAYNPYALGGFGYGYGGYGGYPSGGYYLEEYLSGTLVLDIYDGRTNELIWRGWAVDALDDNPKPEDIRMYVEAAVEEILERFPPTG